MKSLIPNGRLHIVIPNALSLHRRVGVYAGYLKEPHELNDRDKEVGHVKVYDRFEIVELLKKSAFNILDFQGVLLKPLPNSDMMAMYKKNPDLIQAFFDVGKELPDYCAEIYMCVTKK